MSWNTKYWDIVGHVYWSPTFIGLLSFPKSSVQINVDQKYVFDALEIKSDSLYVRSRKIDRVVDDLHGSEDALNHIFDLTFSIAPDAIIRQLLMKPLDFDGDSGPFESIGDVVGSRYGWSNQANVTQQDAFFVSKRTALAVEIKLRAPSSPEQVAKYVALLAWEEIKFGTRDQLGLLFIIPEKSIPAHWIKCGLNGSYIDKTFMNRAWKKKFNPRINALFDANQDKIASVVERMRIAVVSWSEIYSRLSQIMETLDVSDPGGQTLHRLLSGLKAQLDVHRDTGIIAPPPK